MSNNSEQKSQNSQEPKKVSKRHESRQIEDELPYPFRHAYDARDLPLALREMQKYLSRLSSTEQATFHSKIPKISNIRSLEQLLTNCTPILDKYFFFGLMGTLGHKLRVFDDPGTRFRGRWSPRSNYTTTNLAFTKKNGSYQGIFTLVHEMARAFLDCYSYAIILRLKLRA
jgi:hypothetical protein